MTTAAKKARKAARKKEQIAERRFRAKYRGWTRVRALALCGCCVSEFLFKDRRRAEEACRQASNKHAVVRDDREPPVEEKVDGFHGFDIEDL